MSPDTINKYKLIRYSEHMDNINNCGSFSNLSYELTKSMPKKIYTLSTGNTQNIKKDVLEKELENNFLNGKSIMKKSLFFATCFLVTLTALSFIHKKIENIFIFNTYIYC